jgi:hypothetical protein
MLDFVVLSMSPRFYEYIQINVIVALASKKNTMVIGKGARSRRRSSEGWFVRSGMPRGSTRLHDAHFTTTMCWPSD